MKIREVENNSGTEVMKIESFIRQERTFASAIDGVGICGSCDLLNKICTNIDTHNTLREDLRSIRRWHAYYNHLSNPDTNGLGHALNTLLTAVTFTTRDVAASLLCPEDQMKLLIASVIHDLGEVNTGDITYGAKSELQESKEISSFNKNLFTFFSELTAAELSEIEQIYIDIAMNKDHSQKLPRYFNMIEVTGYVNFGLEMFLSKPFDLNWEVLGWRILAYHLFRPGKDIPEHIKFSSAAKQHWQENLGGLQEMVDYYSALSQAEFIFTKYRRAYLPDYDKVGPINFSNWAGIREQICS